jgi:DNA-directed RNA polymerase specialized sigma24 family protein
MDGPRDLGGPTDPLLSIDVDTPTEITVASTSPRSPFIPPEEWIDAFEAQCTPELYKRLKRFAVRRAQNVARAGGNVDDYYTGELVQDAVADTALGVLRWDPGVQSLEVHLRDAIATRSSHDYRRAQRFRHESVDVLASDAPRTLMVEIEASLHEHVDDDEGDVDARAAEVIAALRQLGAQDREVLLLLDAIAMGATTWKQVAKLTGLASGTYRNARNRLGRFVEQLSHAAGPSRRQVLKGA